MNKIATAEELFKKYRILYHFEEGSPEYLIDKEDFKTAIIEYAKLHVKAALSSANNKSLIKIEDAYSSDFSLVPSTMVRYNSQGVSSVYPEDCGKHRIIIEEDSILNAYPENLIQ